MDNATLLDKASQVLDRLRLSQDRVIMAESCTGGLIAALLTSCPGSSDCVEGGFVTYSNTLKTAALNVRVKTLENYGAVSEAVAVEMAFGALEASEDATISVSVTGIAGPDGGTADKPVGTVCLCIMRSNQTPYLETIHFPGDREAVRLATVRRVFNLMLQTQKDI